jgi:hypothetical protein
VEKVELPGYAFDTHDEAEDAIRRLDQSGFDLKQLSLVGKGYHTEEQPVGFYTRNDRIKTWGGRGALWGALWGALFAPAIFFLPGVGLLALAGPLVVALISALEGAVVAGGLSALSAALVQLGAPPEEAVRFEAAVKADRFVLWVHGSAADAARARYVLMGSRVVA